MDNSKQIGKVENRIITLRDKQVIIDRDVAELYGVETRVINQALRNNPEKFPKGYVITLQPIETQEVIKKIDRLKSLKYSTVEPHAFTEQGLYMLATILKSPLATQTTIAIIETFTKLRLISRTIQAANDGGVMTEAVQEKVQALMNEVMNHDPLPLRVQRMTFTMNLGVIKISIESNRK